MYVYSQNYKNSIVKVVIINYVHKCKSKIFHKIKILHCI